MSIAFQTYALLIKNLKINLRNKIDIAREFIFPLLIIAVIIAKKSTHFFTSIFLPFYLPLTIIGLLRKILIDLVLEKSNRYKESFKIMGLKQLSFTVSWMITFYVVGGAVEAIMLLVMYYGGIFDRVEGFGRFVGAYFLFLGSSIQFCFCVTSFFSDPKKSIKFGSAILGGTCFFYFLATYIEMPIGVVYFISVIPNANLGLTFMSLQPSHPYNKDFNADIGLGIQALNLVFYFLLYFYLEEVVQNEYGVSKDFCFCIKHLFADNDKEKKRFLNSKSKGPDIALISIPNLNFSEVALEISNLSRSFNHKKAVNNLNFSIQEGELFCLLGHNGAGKSTTINLLTGMLKPDNGGQISFFGMDYEKDLDLIRRKMGFCPQSDILYDYLTLQEHIELIAKIKNIKFDGSQEINQLLDRLEITQFKKKFAKTLSLGNKRKLSLAMSILGDSKIIFLDEPTSGMDPVSRRVVWEILRELKQTKKSIIFTTHHLDEAEELADRVGILSSGKMLILDTVENVKRKFGMGYILTVSHSSEEEHSKLEEKFEEKLEFSAKTKKNKVSEKRLYADANFSNPFDKVLSLIKSLVPNAKLIEGQVNVDFLKILLPFDAQPILGKMFENLERIPNLALSLDLNSLEDAFINIGKVMEEEVKKEKGGEEEGQKEVKQGLVEINQEEKNKKKEDEKMEPIKEMIEVNDAQRRVWLRQVLATFIRRYLLLTNDLASSLTIYIMHMIYLICVIMVARFGIHDYVDLNSDEKTQYSSRIILSAYIFLSTLFLGHHVTERENSVKYVLLVMGMRPSAYWLGNFSFDLLVFGSSFGVLSILVVSLEVFEGGYGEFALILAGFGVSIIFFAYFFSFWFRSYHSATHVFPIIVLSSFAIPYLIIYLFTEGIFPEDEVNRNNSRLAWEAIFLLFTPLYTCERGLSLLSPMDKGTSSYLVRNPSLVALVLLLQGILWLICVTLIENRGLFRREERKKLKKQNRMLEGEKELLLKDIDYNFNQSPFLTSSLIDFDSLQNEKRRLQQFKQEDVLKIFNLSKKYSDKELVLKGVDFCVGEGQVFGLLGPNGAGKTTTFNILTSLIEKDGGLIILDNMIASLVERSLFQKVRIGICPQNNCLFENLNAFHHFLVFGLMKGMRMKEIREEYEDLTQGLGLTPFLKTKAVHLSGGNKRKLCLALALLSSPKILFLDEPSTGIDPISKRSMWTLLKKKFRDSKASVVLTTHSMNEAEFLSTKVGILINGIFYTINSLQCLKEHYSDGYRLFLKIREDKRNSREVVEKLLFDNFQICQRIKIVHMVDANKKEDNLLGEVEVYRVGGEQFKMSSCCNFVFERLVKEAEVVEDFGVSYCSLEQIFLRLVNGAKKD